MDLEGTTLLSLFEISRLIKMTDTDEYIHLIRDDRLKSPIQVGIRYSDGDVKVGFVDFDNNGVRLDQDFPFELTPIRPEIH